MHLEILVLAGINYDTATIFSQNYPASTLLVVDIKKQIYTVNDFAAQIKTGFA